MTIKRVIFPKILSDIWILHIFYIPKFWRKCLPLIGTHVSKDVWPSHETHPIWPSHVTNSCYPSHVTITCDPSHMTFSRDNPIWDHRMSPILCDSPMWLVGYYYYLFQIRTSFVYRILLFHKYIVSCTSRTHLVTIANVDRWRNFVTWKCFEKSIKKTYIMICFISTHLQNNSFTY